MDTRVIPMEQGSPEWLAFRKTHRPASETPALMGCNPWTPKTPIQLARIKRGLDIIQFNGAMQRGHEREPIIRAQLEDLYSEMFEPCVMVDGDYSASLDGHNFNGDTDLEIKAPGPNSPTWGEARSGAVPAHYHWQIQHQLMVSHAKRSIFAVGDGEGTPITIEVKPDPLMHEAIRSAWDEFWPLMSCDESELIEIITREDSEWERAVLAYQHAKAEEEHCADALKEAKERLQILSGEQTTEGLGLRVIRATRRGGVNYAHKDVKAALAGLNLDEYRKPDTPYWTIKEVNSEKV